MGDNAPDGSGIPLKPVESYRQGLSEVLKLWKKLVVGDGSFGFSPEVFDGIDLWRVGGQEMEFNNTFLAFEPLANLR
jgi:hypothetical protein